MFSAIAAAQSGASVTLFEKNEKLGKKIYITGKGRCNFTNNCSREELAQAVTGGSKFPLSAFSKWDAQDTIRFFEEAGLKVKEERGRRMFPASDHASDITRTLTGVLKDCGVRICLNSEILKIIVSEDGDGKTFRELLVKDTESGEKKTFSADACIVATGGLSYPSTGSTGDGYRFAAESGHDITPLSPALVPVITRESWVKDLAGLSLKNIGLRVSAAGKTVYTQDIGELLFTHTGVSGPAVITAASTLTGILYPEGYHAGSVAELDAVIHIDLKPALSEQQLDKRVLRELNTHSRQDISNALKSLYPRALRPVMLDVCGLDPQKKADQLTAAERHRLISKTKELELHVERLGGFEEAVITHGGVSTRQINPATMGSRLVDGLYFAGEVIDLDAVTGGYNLQIAFSSGRAAGIAAAEGRQ